MVSVFAILLAAAAQDVPPPPILTVDPRQGPMPAENIWLRPGHINSDDRMFPDMAVKDLRVDGETLYVLVKNEGQLGTPTTVRLSAHAQTAGARSNASANAGKFKAGESRWVKLSGFEVKTASTSGPVFALDGASMVTASATLPPVVPSALDRSGQGCNRCADLNERNDRLVLEGMAIRRGKPE